MAYLFVLSSIDPYKLPGFSPKLNFHWFYLSIPHQPKCLSVYLVVSSAVHHVVLVLSLWGHMSSLPPEVRCSCVTCFGPWNVSQPCVTPGQKLLIASALICHLSFPLCNGLGSIKMNSINLGGSWVALMSTVPSPPTPSLTGQTALGKNKLLLWQTTDILGFCQYNIIWLEHR